MLTCKTRTLGEFRGEDLHLSNVIRGIGMFLGVFFASLMIGVLTGLLCALISFQCVKQWTALHFPSPFINTLTILISHTEAFQSAQVPIFRVLPHKPDGL